MTWRREPLARAVGPHGLADREGNLGELALARLPEVLAFVELEGIEHLLRARSTPEHNGREVTQANLLVRLARNHLRATDRARSAAPQTRAAEAQEARIETAD